MPYLSSWLQTACSWCWRCAQRLGAWLGGGSAAVLRRLQPALPSDSKAAPMLLKILLLWSVLAPLGVYGWQKVDALIDRRHAVKEARLAADTHWKAEIAKIAKGINNGVDEKVKA